MSMCVFGEIGENPTFTYRGGVRNQLTAISGGSLYFMFLMLREICSLYRTHLDITCQSNISVELFGDAEIQLIHQFDCRWS